MQVYDQQQGSRKQQAAEAAVRLIKVLDTRSTSTFVAHALA